MRTEIVVLYNTVAMFLLSLLTTYWSYRWYHIQLVVPDLLALNHTSVHVYNHRLVVVRYPLSSEPQSLYVFSEHENILRECNDLLTGDRRIVGKGECNYYVTNPVYDFHQNEAIADVEKGCAVLTGFCLLLTIVCLCMGTYASLKETAFHQTSTAITCAVLAVLYFTTIALYVMKLTLTRREMARLARSPQMTPQEQLVYSTGRVTMGYSLGTAGMTCALAVLCSYMFWMKAREMYSLNRNSFRRRRMRVALLTQCTPDVALAVRKKVHVSE